MSGEAEKTERAYVYMVRCAGGQLYTGWTNDPASRLHAHKSGKGAKCTRALGAQRFAYLERCTDKSAALRREAALKKLTKAQKEALCAEWAEKNLPRLSLATRADAAEILDIYNWYVLHHTATFQVTPSSLPEYEDWVDSTRTLIPLLLARDGDGKLLGYACAHRYHPREAYDWAVESTIYCAPDARGFGVGDTLYRALLDILDGMGYWNVYALVADPNPASERIHARLGFTCVGREPHTAYKFGWLGLSTWWLPLRRGNEKPEPTHPLTKKASFGALFCISYIHFNCIKFEYKQITLHKHTKCNKSCRKCAACLAVFSIDGKAALRIIKASTANQRQRMRRESAHQSTKVYFY